MSQFSAAVRARCASWGGWRGVAGLLAVATAAPAGAEAVTEKSYFEELPVVLSASRMPQSLAATPGAVTVLDREFIRATGYRDLPSLLKLVPGFQVARESGGLTQVAYHGLITVWLPNRMQVLIDGRSVYSPYFLGGADWFGIPLTIDEIERIEVLRGSNSATYGSNAFMGVVNIVTRQAGDHPGTEFSAGGGNNALRDFGLSHEIRRGDLGLRLNAQVRHDHGLPELTDAARSGVATLRADWQLSAQDELTLWAGINDSRRGLGFGGDPTNSNGLRSLRAENTFAHLRWRRTLGPTDEIQLGYYHNAEHARENVFVYLPPLFPVVPVDYNRTSNRDNLDFQHLLAPTAQTRLAWGFELRRDRITSPRLFFSHPDLKQDLARLFGNLEWRPHAKLTLNGGAMLERYSGRSAKLAPRLFANWHVLPRHTLRIGSSVAYRAPSLFEEQADMRFYSDGYSGALIQVSWLGNPSIRPERVHASELGYVGQFKAWDGVLDVRVFRERITDFIRETPVAPPPGVLIPRSGSVINSDEPIRLRGYEWHYRARPAKGSQLIAGHSNLTTAAPAVSRHLEGSAPRHVTTLTWMQDWTHRWSTTLTAIRYDGYQLATGSRPVSGYTAVDARLAYRFGTAAKPGELALVLLNHGQRHDEYVLTGQALSNPVPRLVFLTARLGI